MSETIFSNARIVLPTEIINGALVVRDGLIAEIDTGNSPRGIDCDGDYISPGLVELHTDNIERHLEPRPHIEWPVQAAIIAHDAELAGVGITTVFDSIRIGSIFTGTNRYKKYGRGLTTAILEMRASGSLRISHRIHLRAEVCSETLIEELDEFSRDDHIGIVSLMDHTPGQRQYLDVSKHKSYVSAKHGFDDASYETYKAHQIGLQQKLGTVHEQHAVASAARFGAVLASHDDTTVAHVEASAAYGIKLAEFPTTLEAAHACRDHGIAVMGGAPNVIRGGSHAGNIAAMDLAREDRLDILSSDYVPAALLAGAVRVGQEIGNVAKGIATVTNAPAQASRLTDRGAIKTGLRADLIRFRVIGDHPQVLETWVEGRRVA